MTQRDLIPCNEDGRAIGDGHHRTKYPDALVVRLRDLHEGLAPSPIGSNRLGPKRLAEIMKAEGTPVPASVIYAIIYYTRRNTVAREWRKRPEPRMRSAAGSRDTTRDTSSCPKMQEGNDG